MREVMPALIRHLHDFAREVELTVDEWAAGVSLVNWAGQMSTDRRNEGQLLCDVLGLESYVSMCFPVRKPVNRRVYRLRSPSKEKPLLTRRPLQARR
jgi:hypothetical protein